MSDFIYFITHSVFVLIGIVVAVIAIYLYSRDIETQLYMDAYQGKNLDSEYSTDNVMSKNTITVKLLVTIGVISSIVNIILNFLNLPLFELFSINIYISLLIIISILDYRYHLIPLQLCLVVLLLGILASDLWSFHFLPSNNTNSVMWATICSGGFYLSLVVFDFFNKYSQQLLVRRDTSNQVTQQTKITNSPIVLQGSQSRNMMGEGDYWLFISLSIYLYATQLPLFLLIASLLAISTHIKESLTLHQNKNNKLNAKELHIPFAPYLCLANGTLVIFNLL